MIAVWEPILPSDRRPPATGALARLADRRVRQYWDHDHAIARQLAHDARPPQPPHSCCERAGVLWDLAAAYPIGQRWDAQLPAAIVFDGPVVDVVAGVEAVIAKSEAARTP